ncbi:uncharacterized protein [Penaeus vannamei]|uniref:uncharacterized protein n=1 Tax=Penaeus vannamei TaxID=6689 RepID=UPI00387F7F85
MRCLPKVHKPGVPETPITPGIGSAPHRLAKCLAKPLSAAIGVISDSQLKNSADLIRHGAIRAVERITGSIVDDELPLPKHHFISLVKLCVDFGFFEFAGEEYQQISGLAMGSPLSAVLACLFMETLERDHYRDIIGRHSTWLRYVDDVLVTVPRSNKTKSVVVIGFLQVLRICSPEFLESEVTYVIDSFMKHKYPKGLLLNLRKKANIFSRSNPVMFSNFLLLPPCNLSQAISKYFGNTMNIASTSGKRYMT